MRPLRFVCAALLFACSHRGTSGSDATDAAPTSDEPQPAVGGDAGSAGCDLKASGLTFSSEPCQGCMQQNCCAVTVACAITDATCAQLQQCYLDCPKGGGGDGGASQACHDACSAKYPSAQTSAKAYNDCVTGRCGPACVVEGGAIGVDAGVRDAGPADAVDSG